MRVNTYWWYGVGVSYEGEYLLVVWGRGEL